MTKSERIENRAGWLFAAPWMLGFLFFLLIPLGASVYISLTNYSGVSFRNMRFIGLINYRLLLFKDPLFSKSLVNTLMYTLLITPTSIFLSVLVAMLMNAKVSGIRFFRTIYYLPNVVSIIAVAMLWMNLYSPSGLINASLKLIGIDGPYWLKQEETANIALVIMGLWNVGGSMLVYLAALQDIPQVLYESSRIDGAGPLRRYFNITLPLLTPAIYFNLIMTIILALQVFLQSFIMTKGQPNHATYYYSYYMYDKAFKFHKMGEASAMAWILFIVIFAFTLIVVKTSKRWVYYME